MNTKTQQKVMPDLIVAIGAKIRNVRKQRELTLQQVAAAVGTDTGNLSRMERGQQGIGLEMLSKLGNALGCSPSLFWRDANDPNAFQKLRFMTAPLPAGEVSAGASLKKASQTGYKLSKTEARLVDNFRDLEEEQANITAQQVHEQAERARAMRSIEEKRAVRYMNDPRVQALLAEIEQKEKK